MLSFWIGIAKAQLRRKELIPQTAEYASKSLEQLSQMYSLRKSEYRHMMQKLQDPAVLITQEQAEQVPKRPKTSRKFHCSWNRGDVHAFQLKSEEAKELGLDQKWILLRKVGEESDYPYEGGRTIPVVHFMLWEEPQLPEEDADLELASWFRTDSVTRRRDGRMTYRYLLDLKSHKSVETYGMIYLGNFSGTGTPKDEVSTQRAGLTPCINLANLEHELCVLYRHFDVARFPYLQPFDAPVREAGRF